MTDSEELAYRKEQITSYRLQIKALHADRNMLRKTAIGFCFATIVLSIMVIALGLSVLQH